jgi:hypothetical protein
MFRKDRRHAWLTFPASLTLLAALLAASGMWFWYLVLLPPVCALPFIADAAARGTRRALQRGLRVTHVIGWITAAVGLLVLTESRDGLYVMAAGAVIIALTNRTDSEQRLAALAIINGVLALAGAWVWLWVGVEPLALFPGAAGLVAGGAWWVIEARRFPLPLPEHFVDEDFPSAEIAA